MDGTISEYVNGYRSSPQVTCVKCITKLHSYKLFIQYFKILRQLGNHSGDDWKYFF